MNRLEPHWPRTSAPPEAPQIEPQSWSETAKSWEQQLEEFMGEHPKLTVATAAAVGLILGWMVKRK